MEQKIFKVVHISTYDQGGAFNAAYRLSVSLNKKPDIQSKFLVIYPGNKNFIHAYYLKNRKGLKAFIIKVKFLVFNIFKRNSESIEASNIEYSFPTPCFTLLDHPLIKEADIIHIHWVAKYFNISKFLMKINKPVFWTFHDENPYLKGFHYQFDKKIAPRALIEYDNKRKKKKVDFQNNGKLNIITPSTWLFHETRNNILRKNNIFHIPYLIDENQFKPGDKKQARSLLNLPLNKFLVFLPSGNNNSIRKGNEIANRVISACYNNHLIFITTSKDKNSSNTIHINYIDSIEQLILYYQAADLTFFPSQADNLPNTIIESMACGTPCVAFSTGGIPDLINEQNGYLYRATDNMIYFYNRISCYQEDIKEKSNNARNYIVNHFNEDKISSQIMKKYNEAVF